MLNFNCEHGYGLMKRLKTGRGGCQHHQPIKGGENHQTAEINHLFCITRLYCTQNLSPKNPLPSSCVFTGVALEPSNKYFDGFLCIFIFFYKWFFFRHPFRIVRPGQSVTGVRRWAGECGGLPAALPIRGHRIIGDWIVGS